MLSRLRWLLVIGVAVVASGCASMSLDIGYYWQSITGHLAVMRAGRPIDEYLADPVTDARLRSQLELVRNIRAFASIELALPDNGSYTRYADLKRPFVLWNIFATPELSMRLEQWCFPIAGCINYRGYYAKDDADHFADDLRAKGLDVQVGGVPAYSTLGWFDDPVLSTFINYPEGELARLVFHELAHQVLYVQSDSTFNESFASAVEEAGVERWLAKHADDKKRNDYRLYQQRRLEFIGLLKKHRAQLQAVYDSERGDDDKRRGKQTVFDSLQRDYQQLKLSWGGWTGYDRWFAQKLSNAHLASVATYSDAVPGFLALLKKNDGDLPRFFVAAKELAAKDKSERDRLLGVQR